MGGIHFCGIYFTPGMDGDVGHSDLDSPADLSAVEK